MKPHPNIVFILADDMGYGDVGSYNAQSLIPTPHIDQLAAEGMRCTRAHSGCAVCTPTRYGFVTGRYQWRTCKPHSLVMPYDPPLIPPERLTIAQMLKDRGYHTACVGKWHLGLWYREKMKSGYRRHFTHHEPDIDFIKPLEGGPVDLGFDTFYGTAGCSTSDAPYCYIHDKHTVGIPDLQTPPQMNEQPGVYPGLMVEDWDQLEVDTTFLNEAVRYIEQRAAAKTEQPFMLYYALSAPHIPWLVPEFARGVSKEGPRGDMNVLVDWCVGQIREALETHGLLDDTLLIFTSDNGPQRGENGHDATAGLRGLKNTPYEGGHRVPFVARWPGQIESKQTCDTPFSLTDMMATFAELTEADLPDDAAEDSISVLSVFKNPQAEISRPGLIAHTGWHVCDEGDFSLEVGPWKLVELNPNPGFKREHQSYELYNLEDDPVEQTDLSKSQADVLRQMKQRLNMIRESPGMRL